MTASKELAKYVALARVPFLTVTLGSVAVGVALAVAQRGLFRPLEALLTLMGASFLHLATNVINDYHDYLSGNDPANPGHLSPFTGGSRVLVRGLVRPKVALALSLAFAALGSLIGLYLDAITGGHRVLAIGLLGVVLVFGYTGLGIKLGYRGLGELAIFLAWGPLMVAGSYLVQTGSLDWGPVLWASVLPGITTTLILLINQVPDAEADRLAGKRTLAVLAGPKKAISVYVFLLFIGHGLNLLGAILGALPKGAVLGLLGLPPGLLAWRVARQTVGNWPAYAGAIKANILAHGLSALGMVVGILIWR